MADYWVDRTPVVEMFAMPKPCDVGPSNEAVVLHSIDLVLPREHFCAVMDPSHSGNRTLVRPTRFLEHGACIAKAIGGVETSTPGDPALTRAYTFSFGFVIQDPLLTAFFAVTNLMMPILKIQEYANAVKAQCAAKHIEMEALTPWLKRQTVRSSGKQKVPLAVARALATQLLCFSPTNMRDPVCHACRRGNRPPQAGERRRREARCRS